MTFLDSTPAVNPRRGKRLGVRAVVVCALAAWTSWASAATPPAATGRVAQAAPAPAVPAAPAAAPAPPASAPPRAPAVIPAAATPPTASAAERCTGCHAQITKQAFVHGAMKYDCRRCHEPVADATGKCRAKTASKWAVVQQEPELCYGCHARKDVSKAVHTAVRQGSCLACHTPHASQHRGLLTTAREKICFDCHDADAISTKPVKHAPAVRGQCLACHDAHGGELPNALKGATGSAFCLSCHAAKAPTGNGTPRPRYRIDLSKPNVHAALKRSDCNGCHDGGHAGDNLKLLKKAPVDLCYGCHQRKDQARYPHGAVTLGDCAVCHDPHASAQPKLLVKARMQDVCFLCHQDDLTGRKVVHAPVAEGCDLCHAPHGSKNRFGLNEGEGKAVCYQCHEPVDGGKVKHAALELYGCTACHDPHGTANGALVVEQVNTLCVACHEAQKDGTHVTPIVAGGHVVAASDLKDPRRPTRAFSCASCHNPHGSNSPKLFYYGADAMEACDGCHGDKSGKNPSLKNLVSQMKRSTPQTAGGPARTGAGGAGSPGGGGETGGTK